MSVRPTGAYKLGTFLIILMIGLRYRVGGDWDTYILIYLHVIHEPFLTAVRTGDPAYQAVNWFSAQIGGNLWMVNLICGTIFGWGLYKFCLAQPRPWLTFAVAIPYFVIVVAMGYSRQGVALAIIMAGLARRAQGASSLTFAGYVIVAAFFHGTAVVLFPFGVWSAKRSPITNFLLIACAVPVLYELYIGDNMQVYVTNYIGTQYSSQGALVRVAMNFLAAIVFFLARKRMQFSDDESEIWRNFSVGSLLLAAMYFAVPSSTAVDRVSVYFIPLQLAVLSRVPLTNKSGYTTFSILAYLCAVQFTWLNFGQLSAAWVPYAVFPSFTDDARSGLTPRVSNVNGGTQRE